MIKVFVSFQTKIYYTSFIDAEPPAYVAGGSVKICFILIILHQEDLHKVVEVSVKYSLSV